jgi:hypothetical protein
MPAIPVLPNAYEGIPELDRSRIPPEEMPAFLHIVQLLAGLRRYEHELRLAVYLFEYSQQAAHEVSDFTTRELALWTTGGWQSMAARDGALTIYHFGRAIQGLQSSFRFCPTLRDLVDHEAIRQAKKDFDVAFPHNIQIRHAVSHVADLS